MTHLGFALRAAVSAVLLTLCMPRPAAHASQGPGDQLFQFSVSGFNDAWTDGPANRGTLHLWIPEDCARVRGLLILCTNVPEHRLVGHAALREACRRHSLALVWSVPTFWSFDKERKGREETQVAFLERLLGRLAEESGYGEIVSAPWIPIGESGHLLMVCALADLRPERTIAAVCVKNPHLPANRTVPMLWTFGTAQEWGQMRNDVRTAWLGGGSLSWAEERSRTGWPLSLVVEPATGHFACSDALASYIADYVAAACAARLPDAGGAPLRSVREVTGVLGPVEIPQGAGAPVAKGEFWYWNDELARRAAEFSRVDWSRPAPFIGFEAIEGCEVLPYALNSVTRVKVGASGEFALRGFFHKRIPEGFAGAGEPLGVPEGTPAIEWLCGPIRQIAPGRFAIQPDRTWKTGAACYIAAVHPGDERTAPSVQPARVEISEITAGLPQKLDFPSLPDVFADGRPFALSASSDAGLPVSFYVESGPAVIDEGNLLRVTRIPPRARFPVSVTVVAWQWGRGEPQAVRTAAPVRRTFRILAPTAAPSPLP